jgi:hypothetical protein
MGLRVDKRLKLDKPLGLNLMSTEPRPIKVTRTAAEAVSGERKAIENAKTGKVTAVIAVMYLNGKIKVNLRSANSRKKRDTDRPQAAFGTQQETDSPRKTIRVLLDTGLSGDLLFLEKGSTMCIPIVRRAVPESWALPTAPFKPKRWATLRYPLWTTLTAKGFI